MKMLKKQTLIMVSLLVLGATLCAEEALRGLWVGQVTLTHVNEVTVPLDEDNHAIAPDPAVPTATSDAAHLRLILHVNGAGQVSLLKDVAILRRTEEDDAKSLVISEGDLALVSDERLYSEFPAQEAKRIASAVFDFGDFKATEAVNTVVDEIAAQVAASVNGSGISASSSTAEIRQAEDDAQADAEAGAAPLIDEADAAVAFDQFMITHLSSSTVDDIALTGTVSNEVSDAADDLAATFYGDSRAQDALDAIILAADAETNDVNKIQAARFTASRYADTANEYQRFITGDSFGDIIPEAAQAAAAEAAVSNATPETVSNVVYSLLAVNDLKTEAFSAQVSRYDDTAASDAVTAVLNAMVDAAALHINTSTPEATIAMNAETAGLTERTLVPRFAVPVLTPTADYTHFVRSDEFLNSVSGAAEAAAIDAVAEKKSDPFSTEESLNVAARIAATEALRSVYVKAAQARRTELPMIGTFGPGNGDTNLTINAGAGSLGPAGLTCEINLPASHPTNPFRHVKHPDHTTGINITRRIRLDFDGELGDAPGHAVGGTERVTGIYREEVLGLHKLLGPDSDIGLKVEGTFKLNRVSLIDTLNAE